MRTMIVAAASFVLLCSAPAYADEVHEALEAYALYQNDVSTLLDQQIESGRTVDAALARLQRHNSARVSRGWIAYGALTAAQSPRFATGFERNARRRGSPVVGQLRDDVGYARRQNRGSAQAIQFILNAASADSARTAQAGTGFEAYARANAAAVQLTSATRPRAAAPERARLSSEMLQRLRVGPRAGRPVNDARAFGGSAFWDSIAGREGRSPRGRGGREAQDYASVTDTMLTLAALIVADAQGIEHRHVSALLDEPLTQHCMRMQQLQLRQCVSASVDASERAYCVSRHGLAGPGSCFANVVR